MFIGLFQELIYECPAKLTRMYDNSWEQRNTIDNEILKKIAPFAKSIKRKHWFT